MKKMIMTEELANRLLSDLACVCISANGGVSLDKEGNPSLNDQQYESVHNYATTTFYSILSAWEKSTGKSWSIEVEE